MSVNACALIVQKGDPDRFLATMAAPVAARAALFAIYAFNVEVARAPWASQEPLIAEMRLQWWADALDEIASGAQVRRHEVTEPLAQVLDADSATLLMASVQARRRDAHREALTSHHDLEAYLSETSGTIHVVATRALGGHAVDGWSNLVGTALGLSNYLLAVPELLRRGQNPLPPMSDAEFGKLLTTNITNLTGRASQTNTAARMVDLAAWRARGVLRRAMADQTAIVDGRLGGSEFARRAGLLWQSFRV